MIIIKYSVEGKLIATFGSDENIELFTKTEDGRLSVDIKVLKDITLLSVTESFPLPISKNDRLCMNGYQSWTDTKNFYPKEKEKDVYKIPSFLVKAFAFDRYGDATFYDYRRNTLHGYEIFYKKGKGEFFVINNNDDAYLICEVVKDEGVLNIISDVKGVFLKRGETFTALDCFYYQNYQKGVEKFNSLYPEKSIQKIFGYTSWYNYYQDINESIIERDLDALDERFNLFQIDDGYEEKVGDLLYIDKNKFPNGLKGLVDKIHKKGYMAGIWLAPFVAEADSRLFKEHPEYF
ncbi:MAG: alpha-galactosidase, partial [Clostridia bacterium]|nr:alpha-galactosidase [Clostridia bacterium]